MELCFIRKNEKTEFTRMCIAEAIIDLLEENDISKIRVSAVVKRAGVSRMTFYNNYSSIVDALIDYLHIITGLYIEECNARKDIGMHRDIEHIIFTLNFFDRYNKFFLTLEKNNLHGIMLNGFNQFVEEHFMEDTPYSVYEMRYYVGGLLNAFLKWEANKNSEKVEDIAVLISRLFKEKPVFI